jgi:hypothetical protein
VCEAAVPAAAHSLDEFTGGEAAHQAEDSCLAQSRALNQLVQPKDLTLVTEAPEQGAGA